MCRRVFGLAPELVTPEMVLEKIRETNTCTSLQSPVHVWIDRAGVFGVNVW